jgi:hypothetical protein
MKGIITRQELGNPPTWNTMSDEAAMGSISAGSLRIEE